MPTKSKTQQKTDRATNPAAPADTEPKSAARQMFEAVREKHLGELPMEGTPEPIGG